MNTNKIAQFLEKPPEEFTKQDLIKFIEAKNIEMLNFRNQPADLVVCDAPGGSKARDALGAIARGDIPGISCVIIDGQVRVRQSRNTPLANRLATFKGI